MMALVYHTFYSFSILKNTEVLLFVPNYKQWLESVYTALDQWPVNMVARWENRFAVIDFRGMYRAGFTPQYAADLAKDIATFLKPTINKGKS